MTNQIRNRFATKLPISLTTTYFVAGGVVYIYKAFSTICPKYNVMLQKCDLAVSESGEVLKNRGIVDVTTLTAEIRKLITLGGVEEYDEQAGSLLYFLDLPEERLAGVIDSIKTTRAIAASTLALYSL